MRLKGEFKFVIDKPDWKYIALFILLIMSVLLGKVALFHAIATAWRELR